jgi:hypothetical protein
MARGTFLAARRGFLALRAKFGKWSFPVEAGPIAAKESTVMMLVDLAVRDGSGPAREKARK